jgi:STAS domain
MLSEASTLNEPVIRLQGVFDVEAAGRLGAVLAQAKPGTRLMVDLSQIREFHDLALGSLAPLLTSAAVGFVALSGLRLHHIRLLRYFGVDLAALSGL